MTNRVLFDVDFHQRRQELQWYFHQRRPTEPRERRVRTLRTQERRHCRKYRVPISQQQFFEPRPVFLQEFGIDIIGEDNKTVVHHKVAARVVCVFTEQDVQVAARAEQHQQQHPQFQSSSPGSSSAMHAGPSSANGGGSGSFNFNGPQRRPQMSQQGIAGMGGMGGSMRPPGKSGLTFDHILSRLQGELQKSRETGAELHTLTGAMTEINDTLGGALVSAQPMFCL